MRIVDCGLTPEIRDRITILNREGHDMARRMSAVCCVIGLLVFGLTTLVEPAEVQVGKGTLKVGGILQAAVDDDQAGNLSFRLKRARLLFWGDIVPDDVKWFMQTEGVAEKYVLDVKLRLFYIPNTEITVGRFLPNFTIYMPSSTAKLDLINYPLVTAKYAMWRQCGIQSATKTEYVNFNIGVFNGYPKNNWADDNDAKDILVRADIKATKDVTVGGYHWQGKALVEGKDVDRIRTGGLLKVKHEGLSAAAEYIMGKNDQTDSAGYYAQAGYKVKPDVQVLARYDAYDPNTDVDDDGETWITVGANCFIDGYNAMASLNYIIKSEEGDEVDNNVVVAQLQVLF